MSQEALDPYRHSRCREPPPTVAQSEKERSGAGFSAARLGQSPRGVNRARRALQKSRLPGRAVNYGFLALSPVRSRHGRRRLTARPARTRSAAPRSDTGTMTPDT